MKILIAAIFFVLLNLILFIKISSEILEKEHLSFDAPIMSYFYALREPTLNAVVIGITTLGSSVVLGSTILATIIILFKKRRRDALTFSFILLFGIILNLSLKFFFQRPRPELMPLVNETSFSYPSSHAMNSFIFYLSFYIFILRQPDKPIRNTILFIITATIILLIGLSRIYLGVHYPSDVLGGFAAGAIWLLSVLLFKKLLKYIKVYKQTS